MKFDGPPPNPTGYTIEQPARIALDLKMLPAVLSPSIMRWVVATHAASRLLKHRVGPRVIVSMTELVAYSAQVDGNTLVILVGKDQQGIVEGGGGIGKMMDTRTVTSS